MFERGDWEKRSDPIWEENIIGKGKEKEEKKKRNHQF